MTAFEWVKSSSTLTVGTFFEHIKNLSGEGGGTGKDIYVPIDAFAINWGTEKFEANLDIISITANFTAEIFEANFTADVFGANFTADKYDGDLKCQ